jgi:5-methylcytosine-specific restriction protein A
VPTLSHRSAPPLPKRADPFYLTPEWRQLVASIIKERGRRCDKCGRTHDAEGKPIRIYGDHRAELKDGGSVLDRRNVMLMCGSCHTAKTNQARAERTAIRY